MVAFRVAFGLLAVFSSVRFSWRGWVDDFYLSPANHLTYPGFGWVHPWPAPWMHLHVALLAVLGLLIACGVAVRASAALFVVAFTYVELIDRGLYLNHYWFITLAAVLLAVLPAPGSGRVPAVTVWALRAQLAAVYVFAGIAKVNPDWLFHGEPLHTWFSARTDRPIVGPILDEPLVALAASWAGVLFDLTIVGWLLWRRSRPLAYGVLVVFHLATAMFFQIGVFPWVMIALTPIFFAPDWPQRLASRWAGRISATTARMLALVGVARLAAGPASSAESIHADDHERLCALAAPMEQPALPAVYTNAGDAPIERSTGTSVLGTVDSRGATGRPINRWLAVFLVAFAAINVALPLRHWFAEGNVRWNDDGYELSWRVMLTDRAGFLQFDVVDPSTGERWRVTPDLVLADWQINDAETRPPLALHTAHLVAERYRELGHATVEVYADSWVAMNGRLRQRMIDPTVDLATVSRWAPAASFVLPLDPPVRS